MELNLLKFISKFNINNRPSLVIIFGFLIIILIGSWLLTQPFATTNGKSLSLVDAYFTANSATCVTGLVVLDTADTFSLWGKLIILVLIQIGGLGYMTLSVFILMILRRRLLITDRLAVKEALNLFTSQGVIKLIRNIFLIVFAVEGLGALLLFFYWFPALGVRKAAFYGIFHSVSAFCNAGFDLMGNFSSFTNYSGDIIFSLIIASLIFIGGIGFIVIYDVLSNRKLSLHSKITLWTSAGLVLLAFILIALFEWNNPSTLGQFSTLNKYTAVFFQSITPRTAGFNTINIGGLHSSTLFLLCVLMFIGASPGGTGGGIKTTTFALLFFTARSAILGRNSTEVFNRRIPNETIRKAIAIIGLGLAFLFISIILVSCHQTFRFIDIIFECTSAFGTVGLSTGITPHLGTLNKIIISLTIFAGRIGPITFFLAITLFRGARKTRYLKEDVSIG